MSGGDSKGPWEEDEDPDTIDARPSGLRTNASPSGDEGMEEEEPDTLLVRNDPHPTGRPDAGEEEPDTLLVRNDPHPTGRPTTRPPVVRRTDGQVATFAARKSQPFSKTIAPRPGQVGSRESWTFQKLSDAPELFGTRIPLQQQLIAGRYQIENLIGEGGMGEVYRVRHRQLGKPFALKLMQDDFSRDDFFRELFHREAQLASLLQHPNIVSVVDFGEDPDHGLFMVMELLDGESLTDRIKERGRLPLEIVCDITLQVADALAFSHSHRVVHADVKPDNILCIDEPTSRSNEWSVKLLDFGMANLHSAERGEKEAVGGTPEFMAPERIEGQSPRPSMDIYSLGVLMHLLVTGSLPFTGDTVEDVFEAHKSATPPRMSDVIDKRVPERVELLVDRALAKRPQDRHDSMKAFIDQLQAFMKLRGMRKRRKAGTGRTGRLVGGIGVARRSRAAATAYDDLPLPTGTVTGNGTITLANPALAFFLTGKADEPAEGLNILESRLPEFYPGLASDIGRVVSEGHRRSALLEVEDGERLRIIIKPTRGIARSCTLVIVPLGED